MVMGKAQGNLAMEMGRIAKCSGRTEMVVVVLIGTRIRLRVSNQPFRIKGK